jgi:uncharacterized protein (TIGR02246 family)
MSILRISSCSFGLLVALVAATLAVDISPATAQTPAAQAPAAKAAGIEAVRAASRSYQEALVRGDGKAVAGLWTEDGDIIDDMGEVFRGRESVAGLEPAAEGQARPLFAIEEVSIRLLADSVAIEDGTVVVTPPGATAPHHGRFSAMWVKQADGWKVASLREWRTDPPETSARLADLNWLVGDWTVTVDGQPQDDENAPRPRMEMSVRWNPTRTYLLRETTITSPDGSEGLQVSQRIGWDPLSRRLHSWSFSTDGSHSEADWTFEEGVWVSRTTTVHPDGSQTSTINHYLYDGQHECTFQSLPTHAGATHQAAVTMTMTRKPGESSK